MGHGTDWLFRKKERRRKEVRGDDGHDAKERGPVHMLTPPLGGQCAHTLRPLGEQHSKPKRIIDHRLTKKGAWVSAIPNIDPQGSRSWDGRCWEAVREKDGREISGRFSETKAKENLARHVPLSTYSSRDRQGVSQLGGKRGGCRTRHWKSKESSRELSLS